ncbi:MAG: response regulator [Cyanobacteria bacterium J06600_6]
MIEILIVDDQKVVREQLTAYFANEPDCHVVATAQNGIDALDKIKILEPDVVFMDVEMPGGITGLEMTSTVTALYPEIKVIILTGHYTEEHGQQAVRVGAGAYLPKSTSAEHLIEIVRKLCQSGKLAVPAASTIKPHIERQSAANPVLSHSASQPELLATEATPLYAESESKLSDAKPKLGSFLAWGCLLNGLVWLFAGSYLRLTPPTYTSQWGVKILEIDSGVEVVLPDGGKASPTAGGWTPPTDQDPRNDYVYVATSPELLAEVANSANQTVDEYQPPQIDVDEANGIIAFEIEGSTPEEARAKAREFHRTMTQHIEQLRQTELGRQEQETQVTLGEAKAKLLAAQEKLSQYRAKSGISTDEQITNLTDNLENLRRQKAESTAQQSGLAKRYSQLSRDVRSLGAANTGDAYKLAGDSVYQEYRTNYAQAQSALTDLSDRFTSSHPIIRNKKSELNSIGKAMSQRASFVLGRSVSLATLTQIDSLTLDPQNVLAREGLQQDLLSNRAEWQRLKAQNEELSLQIDTLETRLRKMSQEQFQVDSLKRDLQVAETVFASSLAKLDFGRENISAIYPPLQLITQPNLPEKPSNPSPSSVFMAGLAGSFLVTTGLGLLWFDRQKFGFDRAITEAPQSATALARS